MVLPLIVGGKIGKGILFKVLPVALVVGAVYFLIIRPVQKATAAPAQALADLGSAAAESLENISETTGDVLTGITTPSDFQRPPGTGGDIQESVFKVGADIQRLFGGGLTWREADVLKQGEVSVVALSNLSFDIDFVAPRPEADSGEVNETNALNLQNSFTDQATEQRIVNSIKNSYINNWDFGGFGGAVNQNVQLRKTIEESKKYNAEWFQ